MSRKVKRTQKALEDLVSIRRWLRQPGAGAVAVEKLRAIRAAIRQLTETPCRWPEGPHQGIREIPAAGHRVTYRVTPDTDDNETAGDVRVMRVFGPGQSRERL